jgi:hypothetical protein
LVVLGVSSMASEPGKMLQAAVDAAYAQYEPDPDQDFTGRLVAVQVDDEVEAHETVADLESAGFQADAFEHNGEWYARITDLHGSDPNDALFELGWHGLDVGSIPDTRPVGGEQS